MVQLPIDPVLPEILAAVAEHRSAVIVAPPGAGKTTRVPPALLGSGLLAPDHPSVVVLQPRRIAARATAERIADENAWTVGREVGFQVRFERRLGPKTRLQIVTEGILTRRLLADPYLDGVGAVVLDEFHERSLHADLALAFLREIRESVRDDLILVVMSATLDPGAVASYLGRCRIVHAPGRSFPVEIEYQPPSGRVALHDQVAAAAGRVVSQSKSGDVLVFLPGMDEIRRSARRLEPLALEHDLRVLPLHGSLPVPQQDEALRPSSRRKVVLSTNVAETSLTIEGIAVVIDSGLVRRARNDPARGLDRLELGRISRASAEQRAGRAGRLGPGRCIRLWSQRDERGMRAFELPEVHRLDLCEAILALHAWGKTDASAFPWFDPPSRESIVAAENVLAELGALAGSPPRLTEIGERLLCLPLHPRLGRLLFAAAAAGCLREGATIAAMLAEKDFFVSSFDRRRAPALWAGSDLLIRLDALAQVEAARFHAAGAAGIDAVTARRVAAARDQLLRLGRRLPQVDNPQRAVDGGEDELLRIALLAYPDRVARRREPGSRAALMVGGRGVVLDPSSVVGDAAFFVGLDARDDPGSPRNEVRVRLASAIRVEWLAELFPASIRRTRAARYDPARERVAGVESTWYRDLLIEEKLIGRLDPIDTAEALASALRGGALALVRQNQSAAAWLDRLECLRQWVPEGEWPDFSEDDLWNLLRDLCAGRSGLEELRSIPLVPILQSRLSRDQQRAIDELAPETLAVPSGSRHRLAYEPGRPPILAVRLQELFGWTDTPRIAGGRVEVLLHLLGPNYRPVQITTDLRSFWSTTYFQVRKDLRARYPRHAWPDDPLRARAEARGGRRPAGP
jgi:ATP-dependent helicase HrpB